MSVTVAGLLLIAVLVWPARPTRSPTGPWFPARPSTADVDGSTTGRAPGQRERPGPDDQAGSADGTAPLDVDVATSEAATAMDLLALALRSGAGVPQSIDVVAAEVGGAVGGQLLVVSAGLRWGLDEHDAWASLPPVWAPAARAMSMSGLAGVPPADLLGAAADDLRRAEEARLEVAAARLGIGLVLPLGLAFLPAFVLLTVLPVVLGLAGQVLSGP